MCPELMVQFQSLWREHDSMMRHYILLKTWKCQDEGYVHWIAFNIPLESYYRIYNLFKTLFFDLLEFSVQKTNWLLWLDFENTNTLYGIIRQKHITRKKLEYNILNIKNVSVFSVVLYVYQFCWYLVQSKVTRMVCTPWQESKAG